MCDWFAGNMRQFEQTGGSRAGNFFNSHKKRIRESSREIDDNVERVARCDGIER